LPRAFRRPVSARELERYLALFAGEQSRGETFDESIMYVLSGVLISPQFLFLRERPNPEPGPRLLDDYELASRLSYFLWGSMPDQTLFNLAAQGRLKDPAVLKEQAVRLLNGGTPKVDQDRVRVVYDSKLHEFARRFVEQWLGTRELGRDVKLDPKLYPQFYEVELQSGIRYQPVLFFQEIMAANLSLLNLLESDFTFVNDSLNRLYGLGMPRINKQPIKRPLPKNSHRGGVLGMAAVAAVSSYPNRTSPVLRGKWVLEALLGTPPLPPPPDVPVLKEREAGDAPATLRDRLLAHRRDAACATCHDRIDPIGFGLENYDPLGRWRTEDGGQPIDAKGELPDGTRFDGPEQLKAILLGRKDQFVRHLTSKVLGYALGRGLTAADSCVVEEIVARLRQNDYKSHVLIEGIVLSVPFRYQSGTNPRLPVVQSSLPEETEP
jgi:hypothetical protein